MRFLLKLTVLVLAAALCVGCRNQSSLSGDSLTKRKHYQIATGIESRLHIPKPNAKCKSAQVLSYKEEYSQFIYSDDVYDNRIYVYNKESDVFTTQNIEYPKTMERYYIERILPGARGNFWVLFNAAHAQNYNHDSVLVNYQVGRSETQNFIIVDDVIIPNSNNSAHYKNPEEKLAFWSGTVGKPTLLGDNFAIGLRTFYAKPGTQYFEAIKDNSPNVMLVNLENGKTQTLRYPHPLKTEEGKNYPGWYRGIYLDWQNQNKLLISHNSSDTVLIYDTKTKTYKKHYMSTRMISKVGQASDTEYKGFYIDFTQAYFGHVETYDDTIYRHFKIPLEQLVPENIESGIFLTGYIKTDTAFTKQTTVIVPEPFRYYKFIKEGICYYKDALYDTDTHFAFSPVKEGTTYSAIEDFRQHLTDELKKHYSIKPLAERLQDSSSVYKSFHEVYFINTTVQSSENVLDLARTLNKQAESKKQKTALVLINGRNKAPEINSFLKKRSDYFKIRYENDLQGYKALLTRGYFHQLKSEPELSLEEVNIKSTIDKNGRE